MPSVTDSARRIVTAGVITVLLGVGTWAWARGLSGPYAFDDYVTPLGDPASQSVSAWQRTAAITLRPITKLTYALESETPLTSTASSRRVVSLLLLVTTAVLLMALLRRLEPGATPYVAVALGAVWFLHPI